MADIINSFQGENRFLSNFWNSPIQYDGLTYQNAEAAFQAAKCINPAEKTQFTSMIKAGDAKYAGKRVKLRPDWENVKIGIMTDILRIKFAPGSDLADKLLKTGDAELIEGNTWKDDFWGVYNGRGRNELGKILMKIRAELRNGRKN